MRLAAYAGASTALAAGVVVYAFNQRANFYSACVYLAQSNLCLMILTNLILFIIASFMFGLQRMFYGPLRPIEIEQLYEKAWFAVTETCLAMTIFREEVGAWFLVMFVALLTGKVWGWIGEGRVEVLEQQPPANPRLFHIRLSISLALSLFYDMWVLAYTVNTVIQQARPNMMVMFLFEFAILTASSYSTGLRYVISLIDARITKKQMQERLEQRRREVREEREEIIRQRGSVVPGSDEAADLPPLPSEDDVDEIDIEVPGWEAKGQWILTLDLLTDFCKLGIYMAFFFILLTFYGLPIHIMRDMFLTARSFFKRLTAFLRYRRATQDMNQRYPDATVEEIQREDTCIICREEMTAWSVTNPPEPPVAANGPGGPPEARPRAPRIVNERTRPKKLPCGHVLHLGCLKSWLERQQVCPTCRRPVVDNTQRPVGQVVRPPLPLPGQAPGLPPLPGAVPPNQMAGPGPQPNAPRMRMINFGPIRLGFGQAPLPMINAVANGQPFGVAPVPQQNGVAVGPRAYALQFGFPRMQQLQPEAAPSAISASAIQAQLHVMEQQIMTEIESLQVSQLELQIVQALQAELSRLQSLQGTAAIPQLGAIAPPTQQTPLPNLLPIPAVHSPVPNVQRHEAQPGIAAVPSGHPDLPPGVTIPEGWTLLPLQRMDRSSPLINPSTENTSGTAFSAQPAELRPTPTVSSPLQTSSSNRPFLSATVDSNVTTTENQLDGQQGGELRAVFPNAEPYASENSPLPGRTIPAITPSDESASNPSLTTGETMLNPISSTSHHPEATSLTSNGFPALSKTPAPHTSSLKPVSENAAEPESNPFRTGAPLGSAALMESTDVTRVSGGGGNPSNNVEATERRDKGKSKATTLEEVSDEDA